MIKLFSAAVVVVLVPILREVVETITLAAKVVG